MDVKESVDSSQNSASIPAKRKVVCGLVMPISSIDGCGSEHWAEVKQILVEALSSSQGFDYEVKLVSDADDAGVIQRRIVNNLYSCDLIVCDVSAKNSNVMFELGMRLAFDKPVVIVKDDRTDYSFDTGVIEHVPYPRDLRFNRINEFKRSLVNKSDSTISAYLAGTHASFLSNFGSIRPATIADKEVSANDLIFQLLEDLQADVRSIKRNSPVRLVRSVSSAPKSKSVSLRKLLVDEINAVGGGFGLERLRSDDSFKSYIRTRALGLGVCLEEDFDELFEASLEEAFS